MSVLIGIVTLSVILNIVLSLKIIAIKKGMNYITGVLSDISNFRSNRRIHIGLKYKTLKDISSELNILLDKFQSTLDEKQTLEIAHKQLIANISHDIRTPLTSLLGFVEVLQKGDGISNTEQKEYLDIIQTKAQNLYKMIQDFFELSKLESEDTPIRLVKTDLTDLAEEVIAAFYQDFVMNGITPEIQLPQHPVYVWGDRISLQRILNNLISNALKYGKDGRVTGISVREEVEKVWLDVWDRGNGIPGQDLPLVFNRLYTSEISRNSSMRGTGLGLAITKQLVEKQNGEIEVSSNPGEKTVFSFSLIKYRI
ncbi:sensor histidine kinase [Ruminiclostridium cellulolyticum]|uniref:histidine kinase n=1 Tax=Ruminiclostridium cellulolyticum (strain ATCC 35319 / DSM 5812 / JCM 6584 / H10) TaxID=394503 RepID=B8I015_RUMCH|nr:HAMP domain-containing sensor histidine kinase [Ruminiclostridium cellulolyticum]ACL75515.1 histidine kinase [Ruminiclostridium cellulolyticum H10]